MTTAGSNPLATYVLTIHGPPFPLKARRVKAVARILAGRVLNDAEDVVNDALPEGWSAKIREWDA